MDFIEGDRERLFRSLVRCESTGCLLWTGYRTNRGYGQFNMRGKLESTHRVMWVLFNGPIELSKPYILHSCDTPACCEISHLRAGTQADNMHDVAMRRRGTKSKTGMPLGVSLLKNNRYQSHVYVAGKQICLGTYGSVEEAEKIVEDYLRGIGR